LQSKIIKADCKNITDYNPDIEFNDLPLVEYHLKFIKKVF